MPVVSVNVDVTVWWEDSGEKGERRFVIPLAVEDIIERPRPDELLSTKLKEKIPFANWLRLEVKVDNIWRTGQNELLYDRSHDEDARPSEELVMESLWQTQRDMWRSDPRGRGNTQMTVVLKILPHIHKVDYFLDDVVMPGLNHENVSELLVELKCMIK